MGVAFDDTHTQFVKSIFLNNLNSNKMKYYVATFCTTFHEEDSKKLFRTSLLTQHPYLELLEIVDTVPKEFKHTHALMFYAEITKAEYDLFIKKQNELWALTTDQLNMNDTDFIASLIS